MTPTTGHHMAAAIAGNADTIVTWNHGDFPAEALAAHGVQVCTPDQYLSDLLDAWPEEVVGTVARLAGERRRPPMTPVDLTTSSPRLACQRSRIAYRRSWPTGNDADQRSDGDAPVPSLVTTVRWYDEMSGSNRCGGDGR